MKRHSRVLESERVFPWSLGDLTKISWAVDVGVSGWWVQTDPCIWSVVGNSSSCYDDEHPVFLRPFLLFDWIETRGSRYKAPGKYDPWKITVKPMWVQPKYRPVSGTIKQSTVQVSGVVSGLHCMTPRHGDILDQKNVTDGRYTHNKTAYFWLGETSPFLASDVSTPNPPKQSAKDTAACDCRVRVTFIVETPAPYAFSKPFGGVLVFVGFSVIAVHRDGRVFLGDTVQTNLALLFATEANVAFFPFIF